MLKRTISAFVAIALLIGVLIISYNIPLLFNGVAAFLAVMAIFEVFRATGFLKHKVLTLAAMVLSAFLPFATCSSVRPFAPAVIFAFILVVLITMLYKKDSISLQETGLCFMVSLLIPFGFTTLVLLRDFGFNTQYDWAKQDGMFMLLLAFACASLADTGAYFVGSLMGKHKLAPTISPKKSVEGLIGGVVTNVLGAWGLSCWYQHSFSGGATVNMPLVMLIAFVAAFLGTLGDLSASHIKRTYEIKDYGNIIPGHGGVMDRFDSILLVAPFVYLAVSLTMDVWPILVR